ncbi:hypothetical protein QP181_18340 [Sphingomonas sp. LR55]
MDDTRFTQDPPNPDAAASADVPSRRRVLALGAVTAGAVMSIRPALAQTAGSVLNCEIPVPDASRAGSYIDADGKVVPARTRGRFPRRHVRSRAKRSSARWPMAARCPGPILERSRAYVKYIRRLQRGQGGFTCFASLQMPRG